MPTSKRLLLPLLLALGLLGGWQGCGNRVGDLAAESFGDLSHPPAERQDRLAELAALCPVSPGAEPLRRQPYLQRATERSVTVVWTAREGGPSAVRVTRPDGALIAHAPARIDGTVPVRDGVAQWSADIEGLAPATPYCYELRAGESIVARAGFFSGPAAGQPVRFLVFGDSGEGGTDQTALLAHMRSVPFDLMLHTGDIAYDHGRRSELEARFFRVYADLLRLAPMFPASGNHDYETEDAAPYREAFVLPENGGPAGRERWYSFDQGDVHFVALDTERTGPVQAAWLDADLAANRRPWVIVYAHRPPYSSGDHGNDQTFQRLFVPVLERHRVPLVLNGHDHHYERTRELNGVTYVVTGGGGKGTRQAGHSAFTAFSEPVIHFVYGTVSGDTLSLHAIDGTGREFDSLVIRR